MTDKTPVPACPACGGYRERPTGDAALRCARQDKTPPIEIPTAAELNEMGVSCWTCDKKDIYTAVSGAHIWCRVYDGIRGESEFCHNHPKLRGEG